MNSFRFTFLIKVSHLAASENIQILGPCGVMCYCVLCRLVADKASNLGQQHKEIEEYENCLNPFLYFLHAFFSWFSGMRETEGKEGNHDDRSAAVSAAVSKGAPTVEGKKAPCVANTPTL